MVSPFASSPSVCFDVLPSTVYSMALQVDPNRGVPGTRSTSGGYCPLYRGPAGRTPGYRRRYQGRDHIHRPEPCAARHLVRKFMEVDGRMRISGDEGQGTGSLRCPATKPCQAMASGHQHRRLLEGAVMACLEREIYVALNNGPRLSWGHLNIRQHISAEHT